MDIHIVIDTTTANLILVVLGLFLLSLKTLDKLWEGIKTLWQQVKNRTGNKKPSAYINPFKKNKVK